MDYQKGAQVTVIHSYFEHSLSNGDRSSTLKGWVVGLIVVLCIPSITRANTPANRQVVGAEGAYIPAVDSDWEARFQQSQAYIKRKEFRQAIDLLQRAVQFGRKNLIQISAEGQPLPEERHNETLKPSARDGEKVGGLPKIPSDLNPEDIETDPRLKELREQLRRMQERNDFDRDPFLVNEDLKVDVKFTPRFYLPVAEVAQRYLEKLPPEGRQLYLKTYEGSAQQLLAQALAENDEALLLKVSQEYYPTRASTYARVLLGDREFESGHLRRALAYWQRSLLGTFSQELSPSSLRLRILLALGQLNRKSAFESLRVQFLAEWKEDLQKNEGSSLWDRDFESEIKKLSQSFSSETTSSLSTLPVAGESAGRLTHELPDLATVPGDYRLEWDSPWWSQGVFKPRRSLRSSTTQLHSLHTDGLAFSFNPGFTGDDIFLSSIYYNYKVDFKSGNLLQQIPKPYLPLEALKFKESSISPIYQAVAEDGVLYSTTISHLKEMRQYMGYIINEERPTRSLVAQDQKTGNVLWHTRNYRLGSKNDPKKVSFITPPILREDRVIIGGWINTGHVNSVIVAFDRQSGRELWNSLLVSNQMELTMFGEWAREPLAWVILEDEGVLYCNTGLGAVAAVDAKDGTILWLRTYPSIPILPTMGPYPTKRNLVWGINAPLLSGSDLIVAPRDSRELLAFDVDFPLAGRTWRAEDELAQLQKKSVLPELWKYSQSRDAKHVLGIQGNRIFLSGPSGIKALNIPDGKRLQSARMKSSTISWSRRDPVRGRPVLSKKGIVFADDTGLRLIDFDLTKIQNLLSEPFPESLQGSYPGNVFIWKGRIFVQSREILSCFAPLPVGPPRPKPNREESL